MTTHLTFHGVACFEAAGDFGRVLFDPFFDDNPAATISSDAVDRPDVILISHAAKDHMADAAKIALRTRAPIVCGIDTAEVLKEAGVPATQIRVTVWSIRVRIGSLDIVPVECHHWSQARLADGHWVSGTPMAFIVRTSPEANIYHFGDSAIFSDLALIGQLHQPNVGLLGCSQPWSILPTTEPGEVTSGEMDAREAAMAADMLGVKYAVACHYEKADDPHVVDFLDHVSRNSTAATGLALNPGQTLVLDGDTHRIV